MRYSTQIKKFLYSQYFYGGLRIAFGISLPAVLMLALFHDRALGFTIATGALGVCAVDKPGPLKHKHNDMLLCSLLGFLAAFATGIATGASLPLWLTIAPLSFALSMLVVYGDKWLQISFATLFMMIATLGNHFTVLEALMNAAWLLLGGLWYTYWSTLVNRWQAERIEQQSIAESMFATAEYLRARADFYKLNNDLDECHRQLVLKQIAAIDKHDVARGIVLRNLPVLRAGHLDVRRTMLFNLFINIVDLHETVVAAHVDYTLMRTVFADSDVLIFFHDFLRKCARDLENIGLAVSQNSASQQLVTLKTELRALEFEIDVKRKKAFPAQEPEAYAMLVAAFRRVWSVSRLLDKMHRNTRSDNPQPTTELQLDKALQHFLQRQHVPLRQIFSNLKIASPSFRHALRVSIAVALGLWIGTLLPLTNAYWICLTIVIIMKPGFSLTKQRNTQRLIGTVIGCAASVALILLVKSPVTLLLVMFTCMVMSYSLVLFNYTASVVFTSSYVLLLYHLLAPEGMRLIGERALDTAIGGAIALGISHLFPYWEYRVMKPLVKEMIASMRQYFDAICMGASKTAATNALPASPAISNDFRCRLARKNTQIAFANLGNAFARMMLEPKAQQKFVAEINDLLIQSHTLASQMAAAAPLLAADGTADNPALAHALSAIRENLMQAEAGAQVESDFAQIKKELTHRLDAMVIEAEQANTEPNEIVQELKLLALQCKQMVTVSQLICKDAGAIQLPAPTH
ncbi:FUSC family membrane protein [Mycoavidus sp. SF9855]|uniref:FUSC family protein n=1 Tax=Mycoavidus sp. SF9855 TaxID=2968475 RepID=UPI00211BD4BA|nr:FUSC family membrane protein [Mycoavidus sp. SF9855]UUM22043.1 FUSC family protein [Mycoavidus sp. SF9855]